MTLASYGALPVVPGDAWKFATTGDFDGDGQADLLWRHPDGRAVLWYVDGRQISGEVIPLVPRSSLVPASVPADIGIVRGDRVVSGLGPQGAGKATN